MQTDIEFMSLALQLARRGEFTTAPNPRVGAVVVKDGELVGSGWHKYAGQPHAEVYALQEAGEQAQGATIYVTLEPCSHYGRTPPCAQAIIDAGVARVVIAMQDPNPQVAGRGIEMLEQAGLEVETGLQEQQAQELNPGFVMRMHQQRPFVRLKQAMSLDGKTAMASGESKWITGDDARSDVQKWRARASAIMTGVETVLADDPSLNLRLQELDREQPLRVILDSKLRTPKTAKLLSLPGETIIITCSDNKNKREKLEAKGVEVIGVASDSDGRVNLNAVMQELMKLEVNELHVECGATLAGALFEKKLVDELVLYIAPSLLGGDGRSLLNMPNLQTMRQKVNLDIKEVRSIGKDLRVIAKEREQNNLPI